MLQRSLTFSSASIFQRQRQPPRARLAQVDPTRAAEIGVVTREAHQIGIENVPTVELHACWEVPPRHAETVADECIGEKCAVGEVVFPRSADARIARVGLAERPRLVTQRTSDESAFVTTFR